MAALARRRELALLRLVGVTRAQIRRMVHAEQAGLLGTAVLIGATIAALTLSAIVNGLTGSPIPYVPPLGWVAVLGGTTLLALATTVWPVRRLLSAPADRPHRREGVGVEARISETVPPPRTSLRRQVSLVSQLRTGPGLRRSRGGVFGRRLGDRPGTVHGASPVSRGCRGGRTFSSTPTQIVYAFLRRR